jgi:endonuclease/exonuclease/phosphatase family metal-dependent hydrolase
MRTIVLIIFFTSLILFSTVYVSPISLSYTGLLPLLIPPFLILNLLLVVLFLFGRTKLIFFPILALIMGWKFYAVTFQWNEWHEETEGISLLSFNAMYFNQNWDNGTAGKVANSIEWAKSNPADIKCFQEFQQDFTTASRNTLKIISQDGKYHYSFHSFSNSRKKSQGLAIFSKFPIVNEGIAFDNRNHNGAIFVDLKINRDTIRVYNTHLESMSIAADQLSDPQGIKKHYRQTIKKLKNGIDMRAEQVKLLKDHIHNSPYPVILAGDFNDVPYSYTYFSLKSILKNAFEEAGRGFGFTYNKVLFFLRIDHIFYDEIFEVKNFKTHREVDYSDHYPISTVITWQSPLKKFDNDH